MLEDFTKACQTAVSCYAQLLIECILAPSDTWANVCSAIPVNMIWEGNFSAVWKYSKQMEMKCNIWGIHGDVYEESRFLGSGALKMEAIRPSETSVLTTTTRHQIPEDDFLEMEITSTWNENVGQCPIRDQIIHSV
jgi:hypothetical protein